MEIRSNEDCESPAAVSGLGNEQSFLFRPASLPPASSFPGPLQPLVRLPDERWGFHFVFLPEGNKWSWSSREQLFLDRGWEIPPALQPEVPAPLDFLLAVSIWEHSIPAPAFPGKGEGEESSPPFSSKLQMLFFLIPNETGKQHEAESFDQEDRSKRGGLIVLPPTPEKSLPCSGVGGKEN